MLTRRQLLELGFGPDAIKHRVASGRLHPISRGVYALGRPQSAAFSPSRVRLDSGRRWTGVRLNGFKVDFYWPGLGLVVETDGLRYHRRPAQQAADRVRDQAHTAAGLTPLRFTHAQIRFDRATYGR